VPWALREVRERMFTIHSLHLKLGLPFPTIGLSLQISVVDAA